MDFEKDILNCLDVLKRGGTILYPTDTIWGIGCDATNEQAIEKIIALKKRPEEKSMIVLVAGKKDIMQYVAAPDPNAFDYLERTTKPTTVIYENAIGLPTNLINRNGSIAIRICRDEFCRHLIRRFRKPIVSTSANISGQPSPTGFSTISEEIKNGVDYIVAHRQHDTSTAKPSAIVKWNKDGDFTVLRD